ncbi:MAG: hypothetical protein WC575_00725 [Patescibacteria group bacterium]
MSEYIVTNKTIALIIVASVIIAAIVGFICYNLGLSYGIQQRPTAKSQQPLAEINDLPNQPASPESQPTAEPSAEVEAVEIPISGEPVVSEGQTIINGKVNTVTANGLTVDVDNVTLNSATGKYTQATITYTVTVTAKTKIVEQNSTVTVLPGQDPQVTTTYKNMKLGDLQVGEKITVFTDQEINTKSLTATEIRLLP